MEIKHVTQIKTSEIHQKELVGSGAFGNVYKGIWHGNPVAIKRLHIKSMSSDLRESFEKEATLSAKCNFPQIIRLYGVCMEPEYYAMIMEYMPKGSLYDLLHNPLEKFDWQHRFRIALDISVGLWFLHSNNIIHRDLKSLNVLLDSSYRAKITDFGLAKVKMETYVTTQSILTQVGSTRWRAPELFNRKTTPSFASDVYSFGMVLWEIATRKRPFEDALDDVTVVAWIKEGEKEEIPTECPKGYRGVIEACWRQPDQRPEASVLTKMLEEAQQKYELTLSNHNNNSEQAKQIVHKAWHFDPSIKESLKGHMDAESTQYVLVPAAETDIKKVISFYQHHPVPNMDIKSVKVIYNPALNRAFELRLVLLQQRTGKSTFAPGWKKQKTNETSTREHVNQLWEKLTAPFQDEDFPDVKLSPVWHGTHPSVLPVLFQTGYANLASTDSGFFGKGIYGSFEAEYAHRVYSKGALILNWVSAFSAYPTVLSDMPILQGKGNYENYDAHFVPVIPATGKHSNSVSVYYPCQADENHQYIEVVVFDAQQCLPRYLVELQPSLPEASKPVEFV